MISRTVRHFVQIDFFFGESMFRHILYCVLLVFTNLTLCELFKHCCKQELRSQNMGALGKGGLPELERFVTGMFSLFWMPIAAYFL